MDFNQLNIFIYVYETRSFSIAAKNLYLTQPTVSAHINKLELELNTKLFQRTTKIVDPTEQAHKLYSYAKDLISYRDKIIEEFLCSGKNFENVKFGSSTIPTNYILPTYMNGFKKIRQFVKYEQVYKKSSDLIEDIINGKLSFAFVSTKTYDAEITFIPYYNDRIVFITPNNEYYKKIIVSKNPINNLLKEPIILRNINSLTKKNSTAFMDELHIDYSNLNVYDYINNQDKIYNEVSSGKAISLFSKIAAKNYKKRGKILVYNPVSNPIKRTLYIAVSKSNPPSEIEAEFIKFVRENI